MKDNNIVWVILGLVALVIAYKMFGAPRPTAPTYAPQPAYAPPAPAQQYFGGAQPQQSYPYPYPPASGGGQDSTAQQIAASGQLVAGLGQAFSSIYSAVSD